MIFLEQTVNQILHEEGQMVLSLSDLGINWQNLEALFVGTYEQCKGYISIYDWQTQTITTKATKNDDFTHIRHLTYNAYNNMQRFMPDVPGQYWEFNPYTKNTMSLMATNFSLEVGKYPTCKQLNYTLTLNDIKAGAKIAFSLPFTPDSSAIKVSDKNSLEPINIKAKEVVYDKNEDYKNTYLDDTRACFCCNSMDTGTTIEFSGDVTGSFDSDTLTGYFKFKKDYKSVDVNFLTKYVGLEELDLTCELFYTWYKGNVLTMIGSIKKQLDMQGIGLPFDFNQDDLLSRGRDIMNKVEDLKISKSHWSNF